MALSNRDRVGRAFEALAAGLQPYVDRRMRATSRDGEGWLDGFKASARPPITGPVSLADPSFLLRVMTEVWDSAFRAELTKSDRNLVFELRDVRNKWAHNDSFTVGDTYRALDSIERILASIDATQAEEVGRSKEDLMRLKYEAQARKATPSAEAIVSEPTAGLKSWRDVIQPHDDVARGKFQIAEFAADLHQVSLGQGLAEYRDPIPFFERTYLTTGLRHLLTQAVERLTGQGATPIVDLQTSFGGGKTHSMIALYQLFSGTPVAELPQDVHDLVRSLGTDELPTVHRAVLVGTKLAPGQPWTKPDGTEVGTLWGELAWQLGGADGFAMVAEADRTGTNPGDVLRSLLEKYSPCLVLVDEWVAYARGLYADDTLRGGTFDTHFSFAQALTEAVRATPGALLVVSIPASESPEGPSIGSDIEVGGVGGREALRRLRVVIGRMESSWRPATAEESFEIVRRRLFQPIDPALLPARDATARVFSEYYLGQRAEFPPECREPSYANRIKQAYPIHPELFARLYEDWSTLDRFQRTRGVLRLMAQVVHALWAAGDQSPLILPASVPLADVEVTSELTRNLDDAWKPIIDTDIDGEHSLPRALDDEFKNLGRYLACRRVARTVFMGTAPLAGSPNQGIDLGRVRLGCAFPGDTVAIYADALNRLADRATYLYAGGGRYWFGTQPGLARLARDRADRLLLGDRHDIRSHVVTRLRTLNDSGSRGDFAGVHVAPAGPGDITDTAEARLVVLGLADDHVTRTEESRALVAAQAILDSRGNAPRDFRNMLVFLAADQRRVDDLEQSVADYIAWSEIVDEAEALGLDPHREGQANERRDDADRTIGLRLADAYQVLLVPRQPEPTGPIEWDTIRVDGQGGLAIRASEKLKHGGALYVDYPPSILRMRLDGPLAPLWESGHTTINNVWDAYARYVYLDRLRDIDALCRCVAEAPASLSWEQEGIAVAELADERTGDFAGLVGGSRPASVRGTTLLVQPAVAVAQLARQRELPPDEVDEAKVRLAADAALRRFYGTVAVDPERLGRDASRIAAEIVAHLTALVGSETEITLEIRSTRDDGFPDDVVRLVTENAAALRFRDHGFQPH